MSSKLTVPISVRVPHDIKAMIDSALELGHSSMRWVMCDLARKLHSGELELQNERSGFQTKETDGNREKGKGEGKEDL